MKKFSELKGKLEVHSEYELIVGDYKLTIPLKSLPINFAEQLDELFPLPKAPKKPNKKTHQFEPDYNDEKYIEQKEKINQLRTYAHVVLALAGPIQVEVRKTTNRGTEKWELDDTYELEGDVYKQVDELIDTKIGMGYWIDVAEEVQRVSGLDMERFRDRLPQAGL